MESLFQTISKYQKSKLIDKVRFSVRNKQSSMRTGQELLKYKNMNTTTSYVHVLNRREKGAMSLEDKLLF